MKKKSLKPNIRFKGFTDDWEQRKLNDEVDFYNGLTYSPNDIVADDGTLVLRSSNIQNGEIDLNDNVYVNAAAVNSDNVEIDDIVVVVRNGSKALIGKHAQIKINMPQTVIGAFMTGIRSKHSDFLNALLSTKIFGVEIEKNMGATINQITGGMFKRMSFLFPHEKERARIGEFFTNIDDLITLHQRKHDKLIEIKKAFLYKMFPEQDEVVPEIRFEGFTDAWEQRKLGDVVQITMGQSPDGATYSNVPSDYILVQGNADLEDGWVKPRVWTTQKTKYACAGDLIMSVRAPAGSMGKTSFDVVLGRGVAAIRGNEFIFQALTKLDQIGFWKKLSTGSTFESLNSDIISNAEICYTSATEQNQLGLLFSNLDNLITLHQRKMGKLKNIKQSLLQNMFVQAEAENE